MPITRQKKEEILKGLKDWLDNSSSVFFVNFHGLSNALSQELRRLISDSDAKYLVAKKTLIKKALQESKIEGERPDLKGELALVFATGEATLPAKTLSDFSKKNEGINLLGGIFEGAFIEADIVSNLANLPTKEVLIGQFINVINAPRQQMVGVLQAPIRDFISVLSQIK